MTTRRDTAQPGTGTYTVDVLARLLTLLEGNGTETLTHDELRAVGLPASFLSLVDDPTDALALVKQLVFVYGARQPHPGLRLPQMRHEVRRYVAALWAVVYPSRSRR